MRALVPTLVAAAAALAAPQAASAQVAVKGRVIHTMAGPPIENGVVVVTNGKVQALGPADQVPIPEGYEVLEAAVVTPGLVDARSVVGIAGYYNMKKGDQEQHEDSGPIQPELRALDAYNPREELVQWVRGFGVTTVQTGHAPEELVPGQLFIVKTRPTTADDAAIVPFSAVAATLSNAAKRDGSSAPGTRAKMMSMLRSKLIEAQEYGDALATAEEGKEPPRDLALEAMGSVLSGKVPLVVTAHRAQDIASALRLAEEFDVRLVLDGAAEAYLMVDAIRSAGVPVILHPTMKRAVGEAENLSFETAAKLHEAGVTIAIQSGYESYVPKTRVVLFEAGVAASHGLGFDGALQSITIGAARALGIDERVGSLEVGKDGDLALYDGDPFEYTTHCVGTVIEGVVVARGERRR
ncbi:MAG: amidohydrolase family protein [Planctomycetota bacterium]